MIFDIHFMKMEERISRKIKLICTLGDQLDAVYFHENLSIGKQKQRRKRDNCERQERSKT